MPALRDPRQVQRCSTPPSSSLCTTLPLPSRVAIAPTAHPFRHHTAPTSVPLSPPPHIVRLGREWPLPRWPISIRNIRLIWLHTFRYGQLSPLIGHDAAVPGPRHCQEKVKLTTGRRPVKN